MCGAKGTPTPRTVPPRSFQPGLIRVATLERIHWLSAGVSDMRRRSKESGSERSLRVSAGHAWISPLVSVLPVRDILVVDNGRTGTFWWSTMCMNECLCWFTTRANVDRAGWC